MPRKRDRDVPRVVYRTARCGLRVTRRQRERVFGLLRSAGDVWCCVLELNAWRRRRQDPPLAGYQELCRELAASGPGTFGELDTTGARSVLRRYSDAWFAAARRRKDGEVTARYPAAQAGPGAGPLVSRHVHAGRAGAADPGRAGCPPLTVRLDRDIPYPAGQVRSVTLGFDGGRLYVGRDRRGPRRAYPAGEGPDPARAAGVDLGIIHPYAAAGPEGQGLLVSGRAIRAECRQHLRDRKGRTRAAAGRAPRPGQRGSRRWRRHRRSERKAEARHARRVRQAQHEAAKAVMTWAVAHRIGTLAVGDPRGVLHLSSRAATQPADPGLAHRPPDPVPWPTRPRPPGSPSRLVDERGTSSTCPSCARRVPKPAGRVFRCPHCGQGGHRDLVAAASIAARAGGGTIPALPAAAGITHRRAGAHLPGEHPARRDPRRRPPSRPARQGAPGRHRPAPRPHPAGGESLAVAARNT